MAKRTRTTKKRKTKSKRGRVRKYLPRKCKKKCTKCPKCPTLHKSARPTLRKSARLLLKSMAKKGAAVGIRALSSKYPAFGSIYQMLKG